MGGGAIIKRNFRYEHEERKERLEKSRVLVLLLEIGFLGWGFWGLGYGMRNVEEG